MEFEVGGRRGGAWSGGSREETGEPRASVKRELTVSVAMALSGKARIPSFGFHVLPDVLLVCVPTFVSRLLPAPSVSQGAA